MKDKILEHIEVLVTRYPVLKESSSAAMLSMVIAKTNGIKTVWW